MKKIHRGWDESFYCLYDSLCTGIILIHASMTCAASVYLTLTKFHFPFVKNKKNLEVCYLELNADEVLET
jgi:hypothetical protein